jgi:anthranilate synthase component I
VVEVHDGNPLDFVAAYQQRFRVALSPGLPRFCGGLAGYFGYDAVRFIEPRLAGVPSPAASARPTSCCCSARNWRSSTTSRAACT